MGCSWQDGCAEGMGVELAGWVCRRNGGGAVCEGNRGGAGRMGVQKKREAGWMVCKIELASRENGVYTIVRRMVGREICTRKWVQDRCAKKWGWNWQDECAIGIEVELQM